MDRPLRLGFAVKVLGQPGLKSHDTRRWRSNPHLRQSLEYLDQIFTYLDKKDIRMYRMSSDIAPYATHPDMPQFHGQIRESAGDLRALGKRAINLGLRLSFHPSQFIVINTPDEKLRDKSIWDLTAQAEMLDRMEQGPEAVLVIHVGGTYGDKITSRERWVRNYGILPEPVRRRLVLENDDIRFSSADVLWIHDRTGVPLIFDHQHHLCNNQEGTDTRYALERFVGSWPAGVRPKIHYSSPRTEMREVKRKDKQTKKVKMVLIPPIWTGHADFCNPFETVYFFRLADGLEFDVMLEAKAKDLAVMRLKQDLVRFAPDIAARFGLQGAAVDIPLEEMEVEADELVGAE